MIKLEYDVASQMHVRCPDGVQDYLSNVVSTMSNDPKSNDQNLTWLRSLCICLVLVLPLVRHLCNSVVAKVTIGLSTITKYSGI